VLLNSAGIKLQLKPSLSMKKPIYGARKNKMRVLMISKTFVASTSQRRLEELAKFHDIELTLMTPAYWQSDDGSKQVLEPLYTNGYRMIVTPIVFNGHFHIYYYPRLKKILREVQPEILHIDEEPYNLATFQAMRLAQHSQIPALFVAWQNIYRDYPPPFCQIESYNYRHANLALAGNPDVAEVLKRKGFAGPIQTLPLSVDPNIYRRTEPRMPRAADAPFTIGYIGRLVEPKGLTLLVEALSDLPDFCHVVFIGHGPMKSELEELAIRLDVINRIMFKESIPPQEVPFEMQKMDVFVLPSLTRRNWKEQFGRVLIEAMACETPVIGSSSGEIPRVIDDAGLIFAEGNVQELSQCIRKLVDEPELYAQLATLGRQRVSEKYTQEKIALQIYEAYQEMMES
jgi:glycosyltransferase involved in cell wall biosynthesis